jgi:hypothetical protein
LPDAQPDSRRAERRSYPSPGDREWLDRLDGADYVVFSVSAGFPDRDVPAHLVELAVAHLLLPVLVATIRASVGASSAFAIGACPSAHRTRVAVVVRRSFGFVCCHTAINMLAWLLYPQSVYDRHISRRDCWPPASTSRSAGTPDSTAATCCRPPKGSFELPTGALPTLGR